MTEYKVDKGIPMPDFRVAKDKYPFGEMKVGDSFVVSPDDSTRVRMAVYERNKRCGGKLATRTVIEKGKKVVRVWRIEPERGQ